MNVVIIDGQGGRLGQLLCETVKKEKLDAQLYAVGTNSIATAAMLKAGAYFGATGENAVLVACRDADVIIGPVGIALADFVGEFLVLRVSIEDIDSERSGEGGESRASSRVGGSNEAHSEEDAHNHVQTSVKCHERKDRVGLESLGKFAAGINDGNSVVHEALALDIEGKDCTQHEEKRHYENLGNTTHDEALLGLLDVLAGKSALHEILVEASGGDHHEYASQELFPEVSALGGIVKEEDARSVAVGNSRAHAGEVKVECPCHKKDAEHNAEYEAGALERVGPYHRLHAALQGVQEDERDGGNGGVGSASHRGRSEGR